MSEELKRKQIEISFRKFNDYSQDVLDSDNNTFQTRFDILMHHCENDPVMKVITKQLKDINVGFDDWWKKSMSTGGSFVGSKRFGLPVDELERDALLYQFCFRVEAKEIDVTSFSLNFLAKSRYDNLHDYISYFNEAIIEPLVRSICYKFEEILDTMQTEYTDDPKIPISVLFVYNDHSVKVGDNNSFEGDAAMGEGAKIEKG